MTASTSVTVTPGALQQVAIRTQPAGAIVGAVLATQPVVEFQDAAGNLVPSTSNIITAAIASGGGTLGGTVSVAAVGGVVTFTDLRISGAAGQRTLRFTAGVLTTTSVAFAMTPPPTPFIAVDTNAVGFSVQRGSNPPPRTINITNIGAQALTGMSVDVVYDAGQALGWLTATLDKADAPAVLTLAASVVGGRRDVPRDRAHHWPRRAQLALLRECHVRRQRELHDQLRHSVREGADRQRGSERCADRVGR